MSPTRKDQDVQITETGSLKVPADTALIATIRGGIFAKGTRKAWIKASYYLSAFVLTCILIAFIAGFDLPREVVGGLMVLLMLVLLMMDIPVAVAMALPGLLGIFLLAGTRPIVGMLEDLPFNNIASPTLTVMPLFIFMGLLLWRSGVTTEIYTAAKHWLGWLPGGLAVTTNIAGAGLGAASGSTIGISYALGRIGIPEMLKSGYDKRLAVGSVAAAGTIAQLIPPSILLVVYAGIAEISVGRQLMAGILPGLLLTASYAAIIILIAVIRPKMAPRDRSAVKTPMKIKLNDTAKIWPIAVIIFLMLGGMGFGIFTATESGAVGALLALIYTWFRLGGKEGWKATQHALTDTLISVGSVMFLLMGGEFLNRLLALSGAAQYFANVLQNAGFNQIQFMFVLLVFYLLMGIFIEALPLMLLTVPLLLPVAVDLGISPIWFGVFVVVMGEIAILSPPVGVLLFVMHRIVQDKEVRGNQKISLWDVIQGALIFMPAAIAAVLVIMFFPQIVDWLPSLMVG